MAAAREEKISHGIIFEDHSSHGPDDAVSTVTAVIHCAPGQIDGIEAYLAGVAKQAGVYVVGIEKKLAAVESAVVSFIKDEVAHGEQFLQQANPDDQAADDGEGRVAAEGPAAEVGTEHERAELAGPPGEDPAGEESRDS